METVNRGRLFDKVYGALIGGIIGDAMGAPAEDKTWREIKELFGRIESFDGAGTDDSAIKQILCEAIIETKGHATADAFAASFLRNEQYRRLFYIPVASMFCKLESKLTLPIDAGYGNSPSSSSAMVIAPIGIINACNPRQAAIEAYEIAGLIHSGPANFCRDAACAIAAAVAEAMSPAPDVDSIVRAATAYLHPESSRVMIEEITRVTGAAKRLGNVEDFRGWFYDHCLREITCDSRETVPCALALFYLSGGDLEKTVVNAANFGRDADTIGTMSGAIAGAYRGASAIRKDWVEKIEASADADLPVSNRPGSKTVVFPDQAKLAGMLVDVIMGRLSEAQSFVDVLSGLAPRHDKA